MAIQTQRMRVRPTWQAGIRRGTERSEATRLLRCSPAMRVRLCGINAQLRDWGVESMPLDRVKQPFDYVR